MMRAYADNDTTKVNWCQQYVHRLREISYRKIDEATAHIAKVIILLVLVIKLINRMLIYSSKKNLFWQKIQKTLKPRSIKVET